MKNEIKIMKKTCEIIYLNLKINEIMYFMKKKNIYIYISIITWVNETKTANKFI